MKTNKFFLSLATVMVCVSSVFISCSSDDDDNNSSKELGDKAVEELQSRLLDDEGNVIFGEANGQGYYDIGMETQADAQKLVAQYAKNYAGTANYTYTLPDARGTVQVDKGNEEGVYYNLAKNKEITFTLENIRPSAPIISRIYGVGVPSILLQTVASVLIFGLNQILVSFTETATAVYGVFFKLQGFAFLPIIGMNNGMVPIIAYNYGARKPNRIIQTIRLAMTYALCIMIVAVIVFQFLPDKLLGIFQASDEMLKIGVPALRTLSWSFLFGGITIVVSSVFQALGRGIQSMLISIFRQLLIVLPLAYALSKTGNLNLVWWSFPVSDVLALIFAGDLLLPTYRQVIQPLTN